jgi:CDP-glucose 4,6-dehydratase
MRCAQILAETDGKYNGEPYNFGPNADQSFTVYQLLERISKYWHFKTKEDHFRINANTSFHEAGLLKLNCDKALHDLQWKPVLDFEYTAALTAKWYDVYYNQPGKDLLDFTISQINEYTSVAKEKELEWTKPE